MGNPRHKQRPLDSPRRRPNTRQPCVRPRIIGGAYRGRRLFYDGNPRIRPMKDRIREAVFDILGSAVEGTYVLDLFAGTGALGLEALSRGAAQAVFIEVYRPAAELVRQNIALLGVQNKARVKEGDVFKIVGFTPAALFGAAQDQISPWLVFCSPPYEFYVKRCSEMLSLISTLVQRAPKESIFVVEADMRFDFRQLPKPDAWNARTYRPARIGIFHKP